MRIPAIVPILFIACLAAAGFATRASAENRLALVIGQSAYKTAPPLPNPTNDAKAVTEMLEAAGFSVKSVSDLSQNEMRQAVGEFAARIAAKGANTVALLYYAGHGLQIDGENFLVPVDVALDRESDVPLQAVRLNDVMNTLASVPTKMRIVMLDACRNDPFDSINKVAANGLALVDTKANAAGSFVSFATSPGTVALDGTGANSPYTSALIVAGREPGIAIEEAFKKVRVAVNKSTDGSQIPWESSSLTSDFYFFPTNDKRPSVKSAGRSIAQWRQLMQGQPVPAAYDLVIADDSIEGYQAFVDLFPQSPFVEKLRVVIERRRQMIAWSEAVNANTAAAYRAFLAAFPYTDLTATAKKLLDRSLNKAVNPALASAQNPPAGVPSGNAGQPQQAAGTPNRSVPGTTLASAPVCPCTTPADPVKRVQPPPPRRAEVPPPRRRPPPQEVIVRRGPPRDDGGAAAAAAAAGFIGGAIIGGALSGHRGRMHDY